MGDIFMEGEYKMLLKVILFSTPSFLEREIDVRVGFEFNVQLYRIL